MADKRDITRHKKRLPIRYGIDEASRTAFSEDISLTGMFIKTPNIAPPNTKIKIEFDIADEYRVKIEARVMWAKKVPHNMFHLVKKCGMGIRFLRITSGEEHLRGFVESISSRC